MQKCLSAGFDAVLVVVADSRGVRKLAQVIQSTVSEDDWSRVRILTPDEISDHIPQPAMEPADDEETVVRGYRVRLSQDQSGGGQKETREAIAKVIADSIRRVKRQE